VHNAWKGSGARTDTTDRQTYLRAEGSGSLQAHDQFCPSAAQCHESKQYCLFHDNVSARQRGSLDTTLLLCDSSGFPTTSVGVRIATHSKHVSIVMDSGMGVWN